ncbi:hypothetical protein D3C76_1194030 [compost metagenome]
MRVGEQVEFRYRGNVAAVEVSTPHYHDFLDALGNLRTLGERQGQVGLRAEHDEGDALRLGRRQRIDQVLHGAALGQWLLRFMHLNAGQAFFTVHLGGIDGCAYQWPPCPGVYRDVFASCPLSGQAGVARGLVQAHVARHGGNGADVQFLRRGHGEEQRDHIIGAGVGVDYQLARGGLEGGGGGCGHEGESL